MSSLIGIPCHALIRAETGRPIYANNRAYVHAVESAGGVPILIPMVNDLNILTALLTRLDGLLLPGGMDLHPNRYGEEVHPLTEEADLELDEFEITLASWAFRKTYLYLAFAAACNSSILLWEEAFTRISMNNILIV